VLLLMLPAALGNDRADHLDQRQHHGPNKNTPTVVPGSSQNSSYKIWRVDCLLSILLSPAWACMANSLEPSTPRRAALHQQPH
jgi:hypothetical protein